MVDKDNRLGAMSRIHLTPPTHGQEYGGAGELGEGLKSGVWLAEMDAEHGLRAREKCVCGSL